MMLFSLKPAVNGISKKYRNRDYYFPDDAGWHASCIYTYENPHAREDEQVLGDICSQKSGCKAAFFICSVPFIVSCVSFVRYNCFIICTF
jgi:hypothetical protein